MTVAQSAEKLQTLVKTWLTSLAAFELKTTHLFMYFNIFFSVKTFKMVSLQIKLSFKMR